jgi:hypothetical protein
LFNDLPELDTVVRHEGEGTLVALLDRLGRNESLRGISGLVWRDKGEIVVEPARPPVADLDTLPVPRRKQESFMVAGVPIAFALTSRGCMGECAYCSIRAFGKDQGGRRLRFRRAETVADEIAQLYHERGVRVVLLQDDIFILPGEKRTLDRVRSITRELRARKVDNLLFWIKGRPESITPRVVEAVREMGGVHVFLGIENASVDRLRYLGREHRPEDNERAITLCREGGVRPSFVLMMFDPDCTLSDVEANVTFAERHLTIPWNLCRTEVYSGTRLLSRLSAQGRLEGDYRTYGYKMADTSCEILFRILRVCFHQRAFAFDSLLNKMITLSFARQVHAELLPGPSTDALSSEVDQIVGEVYGDTVTELRRIIEFTKTARSDDTEGIRDFAVEAAMAANERDHLWLNRTEKLFDRLTARGAKIPR